MKTIKDLKKHLRKHKDLKLLSKLSDSQLTLLMVRVNNELQIKLLEQERAKNSSGEQERSGTTRHGQARLAKPAQKFARLAKANPGDIPRKLRRIYRAGSKHHAPSKNL